MALSGWCQSGDCPGCVEKYMGRWDHTCSHECHEEKK